MSLLLALRARRGGAHASALIALPTRLAAYALEPATEDGRQCSWIQVAIVGRVEPRNLDITSADLRQMAANFKRGKFPEPPTQICVDYDHLSMKPARPGDGKAAGWVLDVELRGDDSELWAQVEWTPDGAKAIAAKEYQYVSPVIASQFTTNGGEEIGTTLFNVAITNTPQLQGMAPVTLRRANDPSGARVQMLATPTLEAFAVLGDYERRWRVEATLQGQFGAPNDYYDNTYCYLLDLYGDVAVFRKSGDARTWSIPFAISDDGTVTLTGDPVEVTPTYTPLTAGSARTATMTMHTLTIDGKAVQVPESALEATDLVKALRAKVPAEGAAGVAAEQFTALSTQVATLSSQVTSLTSAVATEKARGDQAETALKSRDAKDAVAVLVQAGKLAPAQRAWAEEFALNDPARFAAFAETAPVILKLDRVHGRQPREVDAPSDDPLEEVTRRVTALRSATPSLDETTAMAQVFDADRDLYNAYREAVAVRV